MIDLQALKAQAVRKNFWLLATIGALSIFVVIGLYAIYADVNQLEQTDTRYKQALLTHLDNMQDVALLQLEFKNQVQEWKNILLRGHQPALYRQHFQAFEESEAQVRKLLEALHLTLFMQEYPQQILDRQGMLRELAQFNSLAQLKQLESQPPFPTSQSSRVLTLLKAHTIIGQVYRETLQHTPLVAKSDSAFIIDEQVRGLDRWFSTQLQILSQENRIERQKLTSDSTLHQQNEIHDLRNRIQLTILLVLFSIMLNIVLLAKRVRWSSEQLKLSDEQLRTSNEQLQSSFEKLKISSQQLKIQAQQSQTTIFQLAYSDTLTGLPNRRLFQDKLEKAIELTHRTAMYGALLFMDLDNFKSLNDTKGHAQGDLLLIEVAKRLKTCVRDSDTVARLGGDEFVVILDDLHHDEMLATEQAGKIAAKISVMLHQPYHLNQWVHRGSASIGVALFSNGKVSSEELIKNADMAMYQAKKAGRNTVCFFDEEIQAEMVERSELEAALWAALSEQQLQLYYQIQVDQQGQAAGAEVLLRWIHPERGMIYPSQFINLAEQNGLILPIGHWVLKTVCAQLAQWHTEPLCRIALAVNVSARQLQDIEFVSKVKAVLIDSGIDPARLKLEITESMALHDVEHTIRVLQQLKTLGVGLSMDDFGIGHSSLSQLKRLPLDQIKIDQSFVRDLVMDLNDKTIVQTIIAMAGSMGLEIIAEGVESEAQRIVLQMLGCALYQGYLFSEPLPLPAFERLLASYADPARCLNHPMKS